MKCEYCGRDIRSSKGTCDGCGAPFYLKTREESEIEDRRKRYKIRNEQRLVRRKDRKRVWKEGVLVFLALAVASIIWSQITNSGIEYKVYKAAKETITYKFDGYSVKMFSYDKDEIIESSDGENYKIYGVVKVREDSERISYNVKCFVAKKGEGVGRATCEYK